MWVAEAKNLEFTTTGALPYAAAVDLVYAGSLATNSWISLVDQTINSNSPCTSSLEAAATQDSLHSGSKQASSRTASVDTSVLSTSVTFAVCYTSSGGDTSAVWADSGIRLTVSKIQNTLYGAMAGRNARSSTIPEYTLTSHGLQPYHCYIVQCVNLGMWRELR